MEYHLGRLSVLQKNSTQYILNPRRLIYLEHEAPITAIRPIKIREGLTKKSRAPPPPSRNLLPHQRHALVILKIQTSQTSELNIRLSTFHVQQTESSCLPDCDCCRSTTRWQHPLRPSKSLFTRLFWIRVHWSRTQYRSLLSSTPRRNYGLLLLFSPKSAMKPHGHVYRQH